MQLSPLYNACALQANKYVSELFVSMATGFFLYGTPGLNVTCDGTTRWQLETACCGA